MQPEGVVVVSDGNDDPNNNNNYNYNIHEDSNSDRHSDDSFVAVTAAAASASCSPPNHEVVVVVEVADREHNHYASSTHNTPSSSSRLIQQEDFDEAPAPPVHRNNHPPPTIQEAANHVELPPSPVVRTSQQHSFLDPLVLLRMAMAQQEEDNNNNTVESRRRTNIPPPGVTLDTEEDEFASLAMRLPWLQQQILQMYNNNEGADDEDDISSSVGLTFDWAEDPNHPNDNHNNNHAEDTERRFSSSSSSNSACRQRCDALTRWMCTPVAFLVTVCTIIAIVTFCILPAVLVMTVALSAYYCCTSEPIPFRVLLTALLFDEDENNNNNNDNNDNNGFGPNGTRLTKLEIQAALIRRNCVEIRDKRQVSSSSSSPIPSSNHHPFSVETENYVLVFSDIIPTVASMLVPPLEDHPDEPEGDNHAVDEQDAPTTTATSSSGAIEPQNIIHPTDAPGNQNDDHENHHNTTTPSNSALGSSGFSTNHVLNNIEEEEAAAVGEGDETNEEQKADIESGMRTGQSSSRDNTSTLPTPMNEILVDDEGKKPAAIGRSNDDAADDNKSDTSSTLEHERGTACDICLQRYRVGDVVAWSRNPDCKHAYHVDCIVDWLAHSRHNTTRQNSATTSCPTCRSDYLYLVPSQRRQLLRRRSNRNSNNNNSSSSSNATVPEVELVANRAGGSDDTV